MFFISPRPLVNCSHHKEYHGNSLIFVAILLISFFILSGCTSKVRKPAPQLSGTFHGVDDGGRSVTITFQQTENAVTGNGKWGSKPLSLSALTAPQGPMLMTFDDGGPKAGQVRLSPDGDTAVAVIRGPGRSVTLKRGGTPVGAVSGSFTGNFSIKGQPSVWLKLYQTEKLLAGTGFINGKPVAVAGRIVEARKAKGTVLFADESQNGVKAVLSEDLQTLTITGLGGAIQMGRQ